jgi:hypothetical protein
MAWAFLSGYFTGMTAQNIQLIDYSCSSGTVRVIIRNAGSQSIAMTTPCTVSTSVATCGTGMTVIRESNFNNAPTLTGTLPLAVGSTVTFTETGVSAGTHTYRFTTTTGAAGPSPNVATVSC